MPLRTAGTRVPSRATSTRVLSRAVNIRTPSHAPTQAPSYATNPRASSRAADTQALLHTPGDLTTVHSVRHATGSHSLSPEYDDHPSPGSNQSLSPLRPISQLAATSASGDGFSQSPPPLGALIQQQNMRRSDNAAYTHPLEAHSTRPGPPPRGSYPAHGSSTQGTPYDHGGDVYPDNMPTRPAASQGRDPATGVPRMNHRYAPLSSHAA
ncbi:hypothetical protein BC628DRAFT_1402535 [Trametes gibbosa]|nr:hypothetical protein BC628DRAFT_1402535 [Trametes gibbosa]